MSVVLSHNLQVRVRLNCECQKVGHFCVNYEISINLGRLYVQVHYSRMVNLL